MGGSTLEINYDPLPSQADFHNCQARFKGFSGPVGSGKSQALCQEAIKLSYLNRGRLGLLGAPTYPMLRSATQETLFEILETNRIPFDLNKTENILVMTETQSRIIFRPVDEIERLRGTNLAWFGLDELTYTQEAAWLRLEARLRDGKASRLCGFGVWTPNGYDWVYHRFVAENRTGDYQTIFARPKENKHLATDYYEHLKSSYDEKFYQQEVLGQYLNQSAGTVYSSFSRAQNLAPMQIEPYIPLIWSWDFNVNPLCSVIAQRVGNTIRVLDEIVLSHGTIMAACETFITRTQGHRAEVVLYGDRSGYNDHTSGETEYGMIKDYMDANTNLKVTYDAPKSNPKVRDRVNLTNSKLRSAAGEVDLVVDPKCKELIMDFEQVCFKADKYEIDKDKDRRRTHLSDALGYLLCCEFIKPRKGGPRPKNEVLRPC